MGCDSISYSRVIFGFEIASKEVINYGRIDSQKKIYDEDCVEISNRVDKKFKSFLKKKFNDSIPKEFSSIHFFMGYNELLATYESCPVSYPQLVYGYDMEAFVEKQKNLNKIKETKFPGNFPKNCLDTLAEFYVEYKLRQKRDNKVVKLSNYDEDDEDEKSDNESESENDALPESEVKKFKATISKNIRFGLHGFVQ